VNQIITTEDGSHTIWVPDLNEHYHSIHGAVQESEFIYINNGFNYSKANPVSIFEVGFGTGLNALLTAVKSIKVKRKVSYTSIEKYPLANDITDSLNYCQFAGSDGSRIWKLIQAAPWNVSMEICSNFTIKKIHGDITNDSLSGQYDIIYFDAFGPDKQPELWKREIIEKISAITIPGGVFVTYSAKGEVKRNLKGCGFNVSLIPGPPGKRQMIRAVKI
jgi:tRNA U34 5-methylaminomethyl-2-thiouridine-forming methyltransferase MnmC